MTTGDKNKRIRGVPEVLLPGGLTLLIFFAVLFVKGIFPFGNGGIDYYDMGQTNVPLYYHLWDFLHGKSALFFDWYINEGQNLSMGSAIQWNISPFNLFFLLVKRENVMRSLSVFMGLRLFFMTVNLGLFLKNTEHTRYSPALLRALLSVLYGLSGFTLTHYTIPTYLDSAVFLPLLVLSLYRLLHDGKAYFYIFMLGFTTALSYYLGFMHLIFLLAVGGGYLLLITGKEFRPRRAFLFTAGTAAGIGLSAVMLFPAAAQMLRSSRFHSNVDTNFREAAVAVLNSVGADEYYVKYLQLFACEALLALVVFGFFKARETKKEKLFSILFAAVPLCLIPFESINLLWHMGTYYHYPIRCGYIIPFALTALAAHYSAALFVDRKEGPGWMGAVIVPVAAFLSFLFVKFFLGAFLENGPDIREVFRVWALSAFLLFLIYCLLTALSLRFPAPAMALISCLVLSELMLGAFAGYGPPKFKDRFFSDPEQSGTYVDEALFCRKNLPLEESRLFRIKNPDTELNTNYGMILRRATVTGWANTLTKPQQSAANEFGYGTHFMRILDSGGTLFSDALLGVRSLLTKVPFEGEAPVYEKDSEAEGWILYNSKAPLPFVMTVPSSFTKEDFSEDGLVSLHNRFYQALSGSGGEIMEEIHERNFRVQGRKALYLRGGEAEEIIVNGAAVPVPSIGDMENTAYPGWFQSNLLYLGTYEDEEVKLDIPEKSEVFSLDCDKLLSLGGALTETGTEPVAGKAGLDFTVAAAKEGEAALLPLYADPGWSGRVNGKKTEIKNVAELFSALSLEEGENRVSLRFCPAGLKSGAAVSLLILAVVLLFALRSKKRVEARVPESLSRLFLWLVTICWGAEMLALYALPLCWFMVRQVVKRV
ncbi:MAG: YfhO family protein [Lachnospiraceae bacterium]|nr:YfhO family protein [Lachnospiraceae bacterium]